MKFSDIRGTDALDLLVDIIDPASNIMSDDDFKKMVRSGAPRLEIAKTLIKSHKQDVLAILAAADHTPVKKYNPSLTQIIKKTLEIVNDPEITSLFFSQEQSEENNASGSATEPTQESEK